MKVLHAVFLLAALIAAPFPAKAVERQITCESIGYQPAKCDTGLLLGSVSKQQQLSAAACTEGSTWSHDSRYLTVTNGCRATFLASGTVASDSSQERHIRCESLGFQPTTCDTGLQTANVSKYQQLSAAACTQGSSWSHDSRYITVINGCRAVFYATGTIADASAPEPTPIPTTDCE